MHRRESSSSTVRVASNENGGRIAQNDVATALLPVRGTLWVHDEAFSQEEVLISPVILSESDVHEGDLIEIVPYAESIEIRDFENTSQHGVEVDDGSVSDLDLEDVTSKSDSRYLCIVKMASKELMEKQKGLEISMSRTVANAFGFRSRTQVTITKSDTEKWTASHVELGFRDAYLARSDMWRFVSQQLAGRTLYKGQKFSFFGSMKVTVKTIHVRGHHVSTGYFSRVTIPVFRSEAARYVLFIQMSREMWDFDSEGDGEIMFNRVINGFLPDLFRRWAALEVRHLVSIVMFGRLEYDRYDFGNAFGSGGFSQTSSGSAGSTGFHQDFYRVVVTDMASAQWTTILDELKRDFRVFLRDMSLQIPIPPQPNTQLNALPPKITGRPSTALKGNILEAINIASSQFANDYIDRDLIRTGVSTIVITAGTGVFDVDRDLLRLTSENLTNNGIGIDIVCLSRMPLHSVPLFKYQLTSTSSLSRVSSNISASPHTSNSVVMYPALHSMGHSPAYSSFTSTSVNYFSRFPSAFPSKLPQNYGYGVPHWIDLSYWSPQSDGRSFQQRKEQKLSSRKRYTYAKRSFVPRVRMYELQMMGLMELGMADIAVPYMSETRGQQQRRRKRGMSDMAQLSSTASSSPTLLRKNKSSLVRQKDNHGSSETCAEYAGNSVEGMDDYDASIFRNVSGSNPKPKKTKSKTVQRDEGIRKQPMEIDRQRLITKKPSLTSISNISQKGKKEGSDNSSLKTTPTKSLKTPRISRNISYALRGLAPPLRTAANVEINTETAKAQPLLAKPSLTQATAITPVHGHRVESMTHIDSERDSAHNFDSDKHSIISSETVAERPSRPILISGLSQPKLDLKKKVRDHVPSRVTLGETVSQQNVSRKLNTDSLSSSAEDHISEILSLDMMPDSIPRSSVPFVRNVNASNPLKKHPRAAEVFGRWQHLYPHKPRSSTVKWRSLCTPASVPLTTEDFPSLKEIEENYTKREHVVHLKTLNDMLEEPVSINTLLQEMISLRLSHGYQVVTGEAIMRASGEGLCDARAFLDPKQLAEYGDHIFLCMGSTVQKLSFGDRERVHVTKYVQINTGIDQPLHQTMQYSPNIRTILSRDYLPRPMQLRGLSEEYPWETADNYLASGGIGHDDKVEELRFWRARFVLLPVEPPANVYRPQQQVGDDDEEEIHLLGIRALTQMWQKARYTRQEERKVAPGRMSTVRRKDQNPLEIKFETLNPSDVVATELDKLLALEESGDVQSTQLLPDSEKLDRTTPMSKLAQAMQGEKGIEIKNRRWHLRLHYNCFHGEEFTNWLLHNVKNMQTREEAVEFGNELMKEGLLEHVNGRHNFKDGNYFYSLKPDFRLPKLDVKNAWYTPGRRSDKSIPPTPLSEHSAREQAPMFTTRSRSGSSLAFQLNPGASEHNKQLFDKRKKTVSLSKMIKIDVDPRRRSDRPEVVNLHYDRLHNPENCYHIELSWLNVTSKLVDDAIISWTTQAEKYGLKLVEVPIAEACKVPNNEPFRSVYRIKLVLEPPKRITFNNVFTTSSFAPQPNPKPDLHVYQKAILRHFNFVLDLEAASEYPENVDIQYSWGRLEYQYTQFVHRSGICLAQITSEGDIILLANRLYNSRSVSLKDSAAKFDTRKDTGQVIQRPALQPALPSMQASGIIGLNMHSPALSASSPMIRASADVLGPRPTLASSTLGRYVTPEQIKDELEAFCHSVARLEQFYHNVNLTHHPPSVSSDRKKGGSTSSSLLRPIREPDIAGIPSGDVSIPPIELGESVTSSGGSMSGSTGFGIGLGMFKRARGSVMYENMSEIFGGGSNRDKEGGNGSKSGSVSGETSGSIGPQKSDDMPRSPRVSIGLSSPKRKSTLS